MFNIPWLKFINYFDFKRKSYVSIQYTSENIVIANKQISVKQSNPIKANYHVQCLSCDAADVNSHNIGLNSNNQSITKKFDNITEINLENIFNKIRFNSNKLNFVQLKVIVEYNKINKKTIVLPESFSKHDAVSQFECFIVEDLCLAMDDIYYDYVLDPSNKQNTSIDAGINENSNVKYNFYYCDKSLLSKKLQPINTQDVAIAAVEIDVLLLAKFFNFIFKDNLLDNTLVYIEVNISNSKVAILTKNNIVTVKYFHITDFSLLPETLSRLDINLQENFGYVIAGDLIYSNYDHYITNKGILEADFGIPNLNVHCHKIILPHLNRKISENFPRDFMLLPAILGSIWKE